MNVPAVGQVRRQTLESLTAALHAALEAGYTDADLAAVTVEKNMDMPGCHRVLRHDPTTGTVAPLFSRALAREAARTAMTSFYGAPFFVLAAFMPGAGLALFFIGLGLAVGAIAHARRNSQVRPSQALAAAFLGGPTENAKVRIEQHALSLRQTARAAARNRASLASLRRSLEEIYTGAPTPGAARAAAAVRIAQALREPVDDANVRGIFTAYAALRRAGGRECAADSSSHGGGSGDRRDGARGRGTHGARLHPHAGVRRYLGFAKDVMSWKRRAEPRRSPAGSFTGTPE